MNLIIAGSRHIEIDQSAILGALDLHNLSQIQIDGIVSGGCSTGVDQAAKDFAAFWLLNYIEFSADWETHGKAAGPIRNKAMAKYGDALLLIWDGKSKGSASMKKEALLQQLPIYEVILYRRTAYVAL